MSYTRTFPSPARVEIRCDHCADDGDDKGAAVFHYSEDQRQRRWKADHAAACSARKGTTA